MLTAGLHNTLRSRPLAGVVGCVLSTCAQGLVEPSSRWLGEWEKKWSSCWGWVLLLLIMVVSTWIHIRRGHLHSYLRPSCSVVHFPLGGGVPAGSGEGVGDCHDVAILPRGCVLFYFPLCIFFWGKQEYTLFSKSMVNYFMCPAGYASS